MLKFLALFFVTLPATLFVDTILKCFSDNQILTFTILHLVVLKFCKDWRDGVWFFLTYLHGLAHMVHPAFYGTQVNIEYTPLYDYLVHAMQCMCIYAWNKDMLPIGIVFHTSMMTSGAIAHLNKKFLTTGIWLLMSSGGIFGTIFHMMLLNRKKNMTVLYASIILWTLPYAGYFIPNYIPQWDALMNGMGLFRIWFLHNFFVQMFYYKYEHTLLNSNVVLKPKDEKKVE